MYARPRPIGRSCGRAARSDPTAHFGLAPSNRYDGAPAGRYAVTIVYPSSERKENGESVGPDRLKGRYADPKTTPLSVEVKEGTNNLEPFDIQ